ncbi:zinc finger domain-containing protein [Streptomyces sp. CA-106110]|uniref:zinc finger domain-containing protein n=1 Tax=Streptomyces sp. CA-106110 TaxID=3240044 RepID=UPI003D8F22CD
MDQIQHLVGHTEHRTLSQAETERLRAAIEHLIASRRAWPPRSAASQSARCRARPALDVGCPTCKAPARSPCVTRYGQPASAPHTRRLAAAAIPADDRNPT